MPYQPYPRQHATENGIEDAGPIMSGENDPGVEERPTPSWFPPEDAAERYRAMRNEVLRAAAAPETVRQPPPDKVIKKISTPVVEEAPAKYIQQRVPMAPPRKTPPIRHDDEPHLFYAPEVRPRRKAEAAPIHAPRVQLPLAYVIVGLAAVVAGGLLGYGATHYKAIGAKAEEIASLIRPSVESVAETGSVTVVVKKSIATATLDVSDVSGAANSMIPLMLRAEPAVAGQELILKLSGLPQSAYLTTGTKAEDNAWQLAAADAKDIKLVVPASSQPSFDVAVAAFEAKTGELAAPIKEMTVAIDNTGVLVAPAAALPETVTIKTAEQSDALEVAAIPVPREQLAAATDSQTEAQSLLSKGDILLKSGDLGMARRFYERAFAQGAIEGAIGAGKTYDPAVYAELKVQGIKPDPVRAMEWYMRASAEGSPDAAAAIETLKQAAP